MVTFVNNRMNDHGDQYDRTMVLADAIASDDLILGQTLRITDRADGLFKVVLASTVIPNTFNIIECTGVVIYALELRIMNAINVQQVGAVGDGVIDDEGAFAQAFTLTTGPIFVPYSEDPYIIGGSTDYSTNKTYSYGEIVFDVSSGTSVQPTHTNLVP